MAVANIFGRYIRPLLPKPAQVLPERVFCSLKFECEGCPYPTHGFICDFSDGSCMRTIVNKTSERKENQHEKA